LLKVTNAVSSLGYKNRMKSVTACRRLATTESGYLGVVPSDAEIGDEIWVLQKGHVLYVLRRSEKQDGHVFVGECYVHGFMDGEVMDFVQRGERTVELVTLY